MASRAKLRQVPVLFKLTVNWSRMS